MSAEAEKPAGFVINLAWTGCILFMALVIAIVGVLQKRR